MPITGNLMRLQIGGELNGNEEWSTGVFMHNIGGTAPHAVDFVPAVTAFFQNANLRWPGSAFLEFVKFNEIAPLTGKYALPVSDTALITPRIGAGGGLRGPGQCAVVISTRTAIPRGRGHAGRMYIPVGVGGSTTIVESDGRMTSTTADEMANAGAAFIQALNAVQASCFVVIFSKLAQTVTAVTGVRVGRVVDTMRSRRTSLNEEYEETLLPG